MEPDRDDTDGLLAELTAGIHAVVGEDLVGVYLYGSYVSGGFAPGVSDLDLVAVTAAVVPAIDLRGLERVHTGFAGRHPEWSDRIEVVYIGRDDLRLFRTTSGRLAVISPGEPFHVRDERVAEWLQNWYLVRETGIALYGPPPASLFPPVAWSEFVASAARYARQLSEASLTGSSPGAIAYTVLTLCRAHMTVAAQIHGSKEQAAAWERERLPEWAFLIDAALRCRLSRGTVGFADARTRAAAAAFVAALAAEIAQA